jgi:glycosyltransferase involved in cell wall biosynthesis
LLATSRLLVHPSTHEGGANVVSEALAAGIPVLATRIPGTEGILGSDYPGYFPVGDAPALAGLLTRAEHDPGYLSTLRRCCAARQHLVTPGQEERAWQQLLGQIHATAVRDQTS